MKSMKGIIICVLVGMVAFVGFIGYLLVYKYDENTFGDDLMRYTDSSREYNNQVFVTYEGKEYQIKGDSVYDLYDLIHRGSIERKWLLRKPDLDLTDAAVASFGDAIKVTLVKASDDPTDDGCYIIYNKITKNQTRYYYVEGYKTFAWMEKLLENNKDNIITHGVKNN